MIDWSQPRSLASVTEDAGFTMSDVAFVSGLDESTVSRLWEDPRWLDRVSGKSLQSLAASVPGVAEYFASHAILSRRDALVAELESHGLSVNRPALFLTSGTRVPHQYLINALEVAATILREMTVVPVPTSPVSGVSSRTGHSHCYTQLTGLTPCSTILASLSLHPSR
jgi:hypothetical protein